VRGTNVSAEKKQEKGAIENIGTEEAMTNDCDNIGSWLRVRDDLRI